MDDLSIAKLSLILAGVVVFIGLISLDLWKALKKGAHWIPGDALVLTALTIQAMNLLKAQGDVFRDASAKSCDGLDEEEDFYCENWENIIWTHISRVMLCVLVAYLLPGMARPFSKESWGKMAALGLSILLHLFSENLSGSRSYYELGFRFGPIFIVPGVMLVISLVWLILLLSCATIAHKSIQDIIDQKIPLILAQQSNGVDNSWKAVEDQVLKSWIVARACYPESIIARSVLSSSAGMAVTICIVSSFVYVVMVGVRYSRYSESSFILITTLLEVVFILMGWAIICWRWVSSVAYYGTWGTEESWRNYFQVEDFWTRYIVELQEADSSQIDRTTRKMKIKLVSTGEIIKYLPPILLRCLYWLQFLVVFFSKGCWFLSELMFRNRAMRRLSSLLLYKRLHKAISERGKVLENVHFLWETPHSVIVTNQKAIKKAEKLLTDGNKDGESCHTLLKLLTERKSAGCVGTQCLDPRAAGETGLKFLCKQDLGSKLVVEKHFMYATKKSWKLAAISLVTIIVRLFPDCGRDCLKAYSQAWEVMGVVDEYDQGADSLLSKAADRVFNTLKSENVSTATTTTMREAAAAIAKMTEENKEKAEVIRDGKDSLDWKKAAAGNALYKLCKSIDCTSSNDVSALKDELESALADIIGCCIEKVGVALVENCTKWVQDWDETKLVRALYLAGKSRGLMEKLGCLPNFQIPLPTDEGTTV